MNFDQLVDRPWLDLSDDDLGKALGVPCMINPEEIRFYHWIAREMAPVEGAIVELGSFLGGSTAHLAEGNHCGGGSGKQIYAYDQFQAREKTKENQLYSKGIAPFAGKDILPLSKTFLAPWQPHIHFEKGRIEDSDWTGGKISVLVLDASKTASTMDQMAKIFFPNLIPGKSVIVQQDELHWKEPWIAVQMQKMSDCFTPLCHVPGVSVSYLCTKEIDEIALDAGQVDGLSDAQMLDGLSLSIERLSSLGVSKKIERQKAALKCNPGARKSWQFKNRPPKA